MKLRELLFWMAFTLTLVFACRREVEDFQLTGSEYAAEKIGRVRIYKVDSLAFNRNTPFGKDTNILYFERHLTKEIQKDSTGKEYFYHQVQRSPNLIDWLPYYTYKTYIDSVNYTKVFDNVKRIHLWWPISEFKTWDGNLYNAEKGGQQFRYISNDIFLVPDSVFPNQINVRIKKELLPLTESFVHLESYAPNIGMVYKVEYYNNRQQSDTSNILSESGYYLYHNLIDFR